MATDSDRDPLADVPDFECPTPESVGQRRDEFTDPPSRPRVPTTAAPDMIPMPRELLEALADPDDCWFDHHGGCQAHGYLSLEQGQECPQHELRRRLSAATGGPA